MNKILLVDDDVVILDIFKLMLEKKGYKVDCASTITKALDLIKTNYDFIFVDYYMDDCDTTDLIKEIFKIYNKNQVCVVSGLEDKKSYKRLSKIGIINILKKPLTAMQIIDFIKEKTNK